MTAEDAHRRFAHRARTDWRRVAPSSPSDDPMRLRESICWHAAREQENRADSSNGVLRRAHLERRSEAIDA